MSSNQNGLILFLFPRAQQAFRDKVGECLNGNLELREGVRQSVDDLRQLIYDCTVKGPSLETKIAAAQKRLDELKAERGPAIGKVVGTAHAGSLVYLANEADQHHYIAEASDQHHYTAEHFQHPDPKPAWTMKT